VEPVRTPPASPSERRSTRRSLCSELASVRFEDQTGRPVDLSGLIEDISPGGLCLSLSAPLTPGRTVRVSSEGLDARAEVRYCELGDYSYLVGLRFADGGGWDRSRWRPKHLFTPFE